MKATFIFLSLVLASSLACLDAAGFPMFQDDFNRPDSTTVGNGWIDVPGYHSIIAGGRLSTDQSPSLGGAAIYRPFSFGAPVSISATLAESSGFGGLLETYNADISILSDGTVRSGYTVVFGRSDQNFNNSGIGLFDGPNVVALFNPTIQFGHQIDVQLNFGVDGSVLGSIGQNGLSETFSFGPHAVQSLGGNVLIRLGRADGRATSNPTEHRLDNFSITSVSFQPVPEPATVLLLGTGLLGLLGYGWRRRRYGSAATSTGSSR